MPRIMKRPGTFGFSSTFIFATVARPSYSAAIASTAGARRRQGPHHSAQKSTSVTPFLISSSKLLSVNVFTFSAAILVSHERGPNWEGRVYESRPYRPAPTLPVARAYTLTY